jgi:hypothetical protein
MLLQTVLVTHLCAHLLAPLTRMLTHGSHERTPQVVLAALRPTVVVVGMAYRMQAQLAQVFRYAGGGGGGGQGAHTVVGVEDAFALWDWRSLAATTFLPIVTECASAVDFFLESISPRHAPVRLS